MNRAPLIKICGIGCIEDALVAKDAGADAIGLVHHPKSPRHIDLEESRDIIKQLPTHIEPIHVCVDHDAEEIKKFESRWVQLHGKETAEDVSRICTITEKRIIRGFTFSEESCRAWDTHPDVDVLLLDGDAAGSGETFDHSMLADLIPTLRTPIIIAGGLNPDNVGDLLQKVHPFGVDVSSGVEHTRGQKDHGLIRAFCDAIRSSRH